MQEALPVISGKGPGLAILLPYLVEVLAAYSHSAQASELRLCVQDASAKKRLTRRPVTRQQWSLTDRLNEAQILAIVHAYLSGATAAQLAAAYGLSLSSLKRIFQSAGATKIHIAS
jgi:DNA invertase Pin-like site-specific DNA recombinase